MTIRVLLCDDQEVVLAGLRAILGACDGIDIVGACRHGAEALAAIPEARPDVVLMDLKMPVLNGVQATRDIRQRYPSVRVLVLTTYDADEWVYDAIRAGADGYLLKDAPRERLVAAIRDAAAGRTPVDPAVAGKLFSTVASGPPSPRTPEDCPGWRTLSGRERDVFALIGTGMSNSDVAGRLFLSEGTVRNYVSSLLAKLGVADRTQAAVLALRYGVVGDVDPEPKPGRPALRERREDRTAG